MPTYDTVELTVDERGVARLALDRPDKQNALSPDLQQDLHDALGAADERDARIVVVSGNGDAFCGGMDLKEAFLRPRQEGPRAFEAATETILEAMVRLKRFDAPTVAKVDGYAFGGGYELMGVCDFAVAAEDATFGLSEINFGVFPGGGTMWATAHTMNRRKAMYYAATGETFTGREAEAYGAVTEAVPAEELDGRVEDLVATLLEKNPLALRFNKEVFDRARYMEFEESVDYEIAKLEQMSYLQDEEWIAEALTQFEDREYRPGVEPYDRDEGE